MPHPAAVDVFPDKAILGARGRGREARSQNHTTRLRVGAADCASTKMPLFELFVYCVLWFAVFCFFCIFQGCRM